MPIYQFNVNSPFKKKKKNYDFSLYNLLSFWKKKVRITYEYFKFRCTELSVTGVTTLKNVSPLLS